MDATQTESLSFEDCYSRLEEVIDKLEQGDLSVEESVALYEEGMQLAQRCDRELNDAELRVSQLLSVAAEEDEEVPFTGED